MPAPAIQEAPRGAISRWGTPLAALLILGYMLWFGRDGFRAVLNGDDLMNMHGYWEQSPWKLVVSQVAFFTSNYRPVGGLFYMPLYHLAGFHPLPYHLAAFAFMMANVFLVWRVARRLTGLPAAAGLAALLVSYHAAMGELYYSTGVIYDILCFLFYFLALDWYTGFRARGEVAGPRRLLVLAALYACALNAKEMAVTLPVILLAYEWFYHPPKSWTCEALKRWCAADARGVWVTAAMTALYIYGKTHGPEAIANLAGYQGVYTVSQFLRANRDYLAQHIFGSVHFTGARVILLWAAMLGLAAVLKRADLRLLCVWAVVSPLPVVFVQRAHSAVFIPYVGLAMFAACLIMLGARSAARALRIGAAPVQLAAALALAAPFTVANVRGKALGQPFIDADGRSTWAVVEQLQALHLKVPPRAKILFLDNPFPNWDVYFIAVLLVNDPTVEIWVDQPDRHLEEGPEYSHVFRFEKGRLVQVKPPRVG